MRTSFKHHLCVSVVAALLLFGAARASADPYFTLETIGDWPPRSAPATLRPYCPTNGTRT